MTTLNHNAAWKPQLTIITTQDDIGKDALTGFDLSSYQQFTTTGKAVGDKPRRYSIGSAAFIGGEKHSREHIKFLREIT